MCGIPDKHAKANFNSIIVRLKAVMHKINKFEFSIFQFNYCTIKSVTSTSHTHNLVNFNSIIVRLKDYPHAENLSARNDFNSIIVRLKACLNKQEDALNKISIQLLYD